MGMDINMETPTDDTPRKLHGLFLPDDDELPDTPVEFKKHMAKEFRDMGLSMEEIRQLITMMK